MMDWIQENTALLLLGLCGAVLLLFFLCIWLCIRLNGQKKRYDIFMGTGKRPAHNLEMKLEKFYESSKHIEEQYSKLLDMVSDMDKTTKSQIQKVGLIRYNPFDEMGGNLCFALALLDGNDNGVVLNGIHSRTGSFTYAKPIEMGVSTYMLSEEEIKAVQMAKESAYQPEHEKVVKVRFKPTFRRKDKVPKAPQQMPEVLKTDERTEQKEKYTSIGDVTQEEKERILAEEALAGEIAVAGMSRRRVKAKLLQEEAVQKAAAQAREQTKLSVEKAVEEVENIENAETEQMEPIKEADTAEICPEEIPYFLEPVYLEKEAEEKA